MLGVSGVLFVLVSYRHHTSKDADRVAMGQSAGPRVKRLADHPSLCQRSISAPWVSVQQSLRVTDWVIRFIFAARDTLMFGSCQMGNSGCARGYVLTGLQLEYDMLSGLRVVARCPSCHKLKHPSRCKNTKWNTLRRSPSGVAPCTANLMCVSHRDVCAPACGLGHVRTNCTCTYFRRHDCCANAS